MPSYENILRYQGAINGVATRYGQSWAPSRQRVYDFPKPLPHETVSSWLLRYALLRQRSPGWILNFIGSVWKKPMCWMDFDADSLPWEHLGEMICIDPDSLRLLVPSWSECLKHPELLCLQADPLRMLPQFRYCDVCLSNDPIPYYRQSWRLASTWVCPTHGTVMRDACPHCLSPFTWIHSRTKRARFSSLRACLNCGGDLCTTNEPTDFPAGLAKVVVATQSHFEFLLSALANGCRKHTQVAHQGQDISPSWKSPAPDRKPKIWPASSSEVQCMALGDDIDQVRSKLHEALRSVNLNRKGQSTSIQITIGIDAKRVFGQKAGHIGSYLMTHQNIFGTTVWWPGEDIYKDASLAKWGSTDCIRAQRWISEFCSRSSVAPLSNRKSD